jgi:CDP-paratose 2-epimerase
MNTLPDAPAVLRRSPYVLVTGGAGFVGSNLVDRLALSGRSVLVFDSLARAHVSENLDWLSGRHGGRVAAEIGDVRDSMAVRDVVRGATVVYHLAAQVAVTCSLDDPMSDFEVNARGTLNVLEAIRACAAPPPIVFTSTNKVYGVACSLAELREDKLRYSACSPELRGGFSEVQPLDLHSPYGCSKGAADQYVIDYARVFGIAAVVFRMSCIYGPRQFGNEDQGWVAHFLRSVLLGQPITVYGNGKQVRDLLFVDDLIDAFLAAEERMALISGRAFNIGGGPQSTASVLEILEFAERAAGSLATVAFAETRPGDQPYYVSDTSSFAARTGWRPRVPLADGLRILAEWLGEWAHRNNAVQPQQQEAWTCASL